MAEGQKHTEEPWIYRLKHPTAVNAGISILGPEDQLHCRKVIAELDYREGAEANAHRIVACVNACAGISTEALEGRIVETAMNSVASAMEITRAESGLVKALEFYAREWQGNADGAMDGTPGLTRTWQEPTDALWHDAGRKAEYALAKHKATGQQDEKAAVQPDELGKIIYKALNRHKMVHQKIRDTDMALPLVDYLTPDGWMTINGGMEENEAITETILEAIAPYITPNRQSSEPQGQHDDGWQPIETAPKDGTTVDLWVVTALNDGQPSHGNRVPECYWQEDRGRWINPAEYYEWVEEPFANGRRIVTRWMPLPKPPAAKAD